MFTSFKSIVRDSYDRMKLIFTKFSSYKFIPITFLLIFTGLFSILGHMFLHRIAYYIKEDPDKMSADIGLFWFFKCIWKLLLPIFIIGVELLLVVCVAKSPYINNIVKVIISSIMVLVMLITALATLFYMTSTFLNVKISFIEHFKRVGKNIPVILLTVILNAIIFISLHLLLFLSVAPFCYYYGIEFRSVSPIVAIVGAMLHSVFNVLIAVSTYVHIMDNHNKPAKLQEKSDNPAIE